MAAASSEVALESKHDWRSTSNVSYNANLAVKIERMISKNPGP